MSGTVSVVDKGGRPATDLSETIVYLEGAKGSPKLSKTTMTMKAKAFLPRVVVIPVGGTVEFPNEDPIFHNVFSVSGENRFDLDLYKRPKSASWTFQHPGIVRVYCNIHPQMSGIVVVRDNPYFTKAAADGTFTLDSVPAGKYVLKAWHERGGEASLDVVVATEGKASAQLNLDTAAFKRVPHKNKFGKDYSAPSDEKY